MKQIDAPDSLSRPGITWFVQIYVLESDTMRSIDRIESVLNRDAKTATYKLALFRALSDIALDGYNSARWLPDGKVGLPIGMVAEKWLLYYWPLFDSETFIPQKHGATPGCDKPVKFRSHLCALIEKYPHPTGGRQRFFRDMADGTSPDEAKTALKVIAETIIRGPVQYSGGAIQERIFDYDTSGKLIVMSADIWKELVLMGHWIRDALVLRWSELTSRMSDGEIPASAVLELLLQLPSDERDTSLSRSFFGTLPRLECVWSGKEIAKDFAVDHVLPFAWWRNNELWNLLPSAPEVNTKKSDCLPEKQLLLRRKDAVIEYWRRMDSSFPNRFPREISRFTGRPATADWELSLFSSLVEAVEYTALLRGVKRWSV